MDMDNRVVIAVGVEVEEELWDVSGDENNKRKG